MKTAAAASVGLHAAVVAAAFWWSFGAAVTAPPSAAVEVVFWPQPVAEPAPAAESSPAPAAASALEPTPAAEAPTESPAQSAPEPPVAAVADAPAPPAVAPPPRKVKRREPAPAAPKPELPTAVAAAPVEAPPALRPHVHTEPGAAAATGALASVAPAAPTGPVEPPLITSARFRSPPSPPAYPRRAVDLGQEGEVILRALVSADGESREIRIFRSSGVALLDDAALRAVRRWAFEAAQINGRPIDAWVEVPVRFHLRSVL